MDILTRYFADFSATQQEQFRQLEPLYREWNEKINVISRKDIASLYERHVLHSLSIAPALFWSWTILLGVFIVDATFTLLKRIARGRTFYEAHRSHAYQHAARRFGHLRVSVGVGLLNMLWLLPIAWLVATGRLAGAVGLLVGYVPLLAAALYFRAGSES